MFSQLLAEVSRLEPSSCNLYNGVVSVDVVIPGQDAHRHPFWVILVLCLLNSIHPILPSE